MASFYQNIEKSFEKLMGVALKIYGNSITFIAACVLVLVFACDKRFYDQPLHNIIRDVILMITFLSFFIIQKAFNKYSKAMHLKMNELVSSHETASNKLLNVEDKTEAQMKEIAE